MAIHGSLSHYTLFTEVTRPVVHYDPQICATSTVFRDRVIKLVFTHSFGVR